MIQFSMLELSKYDPGKDIILAYVNVGKMPPTRVHKYMKSIRKEVSPLFGELGFQSLFLPLRESDNISVPGNFVFKVEDLDVVKEQLNEQINESHEDKFDNAMKSV